MKYRTLCRLAVRLIGLFFLAKGMIETPTVVGGFWSIFIATSVSGNVKLYYAILCLAPILSFAIGGYLFAGGERVVNFIIPTNRPFCQECGYDLTNPANKICPECGKPHEYGVVGPLS